jgi:hypothetical protein
MSGFKWAAVALLLGSNAALAQGTQQSIPSGAGGPTGSAQRIGNSGAPVATKSYNYAPGPAAKSYVIVTPARKR